jgi:hypothetical protein
MGNRDNGDTPAGAKHQAAEAIEILKGNQPDACRDADQGDERRANLDSAPHRARG